MSEKNSALLIVWVALMTLAVSLHTWMTSSSVDELRADVDRLEEQVGDLGGDRACSVRVFVEHADAGTAAGE